MLPPPPLPPQITSARQSYTMKFTLLLLGIIASVANCLPQLSSTTPPPALASTITNTNGFQESDIYAPLFNYPPAMAYCSKEYPSDTATMKQRHRVARGQPRGPFKPNMSPSREWSPLGHGSMGSHGPVNSHGSMDPDDSMDSQWSALLSEPKDVMSAFCSCIEHQTTVGCHACFKCMHCTNDHLEHPLDH